MFLIYDRSPWQAIMACHLYFKSLYDVIHMEKSPQCMIFCVKGKDMGHITLEIVLSLIHKDQKDP